MLQMPTFSLIILSRNELTGMKIILPRIHREWVDEILIVDGDSTDGSREYAESLGFRVLKQKNFKPTRKVRGPFPEHASGPVEALREAFAAAKGDYVITFTPDNNSIPELIPALVAKLKEGYDMVTVSRYKDGAKSQDDSRTTSFGNWMITGLVNLLHGTRYTDVMCIFRGYRRNLIQELEIDMKLSLHTQLSIRCKKYKKSTAEIPGDEPPRVGGHTIRNNFKNGLVELYTIFEEFFSTPKPK